MSNFSCPVQFYWIYLFCSKCFVWVSSLKKSLNKLVKTFQILLTQGIFQTYIMFDYRTLPPFVKIFQNKILKYLNKCAHKTGRKSPSNPAKSKSSNQNKSYPKFQRCIQNPVENFQLLFIDLQKKLHRRCLNGSSIPTPLKLLIKTPEQQHSRRSC